MCLGGVLRVSGRCLEDVWKVSGSSLEGRECQEGGRRMSEGVWRLS